MIQDYLSIDTMRTKPEDFFLTMKDGLEDFFNITSSLEPSNGDNGHHKVYKFEEKEAPAHKRTFWLRQKGEAGLEVEKITFGDQIKEMGEGYYNSLQDFFYYINGNLNCFSDYSISLYDAEENITESSTLSGRKRWNTRYIGNAS